MDSRQEIINSVTYLINLCDRKNINTDKLNRVIELTSWLDMNNLRIEFLRAVSDSLNKLYDIEKNVKTS